MSVRELDIGYNRYKYVQRTKENFVQCRKLRYFENV